MTDQNELSQGHLFSISVTSKGVYRVSDDPTYYDSDWSGPPFRLDIRAFDLPTALREAAELPLSAWEMPDLDSPETTTFQVVREWLKGSDTTKPDNLTWDEWRNQQAGDLVERLRLHFISRYHLGGE